MPIPYKIAVLKEEPGIMDVKKLNDIALFRYAVIAPLVTGTLEDGLSETEFFERAASKVYENPKGEDIKISKYTIRRWYKIYKSEGFDGLKPKVRSDRSKYRKVDDDIISQVTYLIKEYPRLPATLIYQRLKDNGTISTSELSLSTINRVVNKLKEDNGVIKNKDMRRYERKHINEVWCGDSSVGPYLKVNGKKERTYIIALIDDASRYIVGIDIFFNDNFVNLMGVMKSAVRKNGKPKLFNFDNGSNYRCGQMTLLGARMGSVLNYCAVKTPTSKAKIERWFKTMKDHWMAGLNMNDYKSIDELRESLMKYVQSYNQTIHQSLNGKTPQDRFFEESALITRFDDESIDKIFLLEIERKVSNDNVIVIDQKEYEVNYKYAGQKLLLRYSPDLSQIYVVDRETNQLEEIHLLDKKANSTIKREKVKFTEEI